MATPENPAHKEKAEFFYNAHRQLGPTLKKIDELRQNGVGLNHQDPHEVIGEVPPGNIDVPGVIIFNKDEINPPSDRFKRIRESIRSTASNKRILIPVVTVGGIVMATVGTAWAVRHLMEHGSHTDITDD